MTPARLLTAKRFRPAAQGWRRGYPGITNENDHPTTRWLRHFFCRVKKRRNRVAVEISKPLPTQGSRSGNPGLEAVTALRFGTRHNDRDSSLDSLRALIEDAVTSFHGCNRI